METDASRTSYPRHAEHEAFVSALPEALFAYLDDQSHLSAHMSERSWMMGGGRMDISTDDGGGRRVGSRLALEGRVLGMRLHVEGIVTDREPPWRKRWETVGEPRLLIIGAYRMGLTITPEADGARLRIDIDYALPIRGFGVLLGRLFGPFYARWCTAQMVGDAVRHFTMSSGRGASVDEVGAIAR